MKRQTTIESLKCELSKAQEQRDNFKKKFHRCKKRLKRKESKLSESEHKLTETIKQTELSSYEKEQFLKGKGTIAGKLYQRSIEVRHDYKDLQFKRFAMTLHFYSPKAYCFIIIIIHSCRYHR